MFSEMFYKLWNNGLIQLGIWETVYMTLISSAFAYLIGLPLGVILNVTDKKGIAPHPKLNSVLGFVVNFFRSIPFIILMVAMLPVAKFLVGTMIGNKAVIVMLIVAAAPYVARMVESSLNEVNVGVIEAAQSMGASNFEIICKVLVPEAKPALITGAAISVVTILGYSAMAATIGGTGLGQIAIVYGHQRFNNGWTYHDAIMGDAMGRDARKYYGAIRHYLPNETSIGLYAQRTEMERGMRIHPTVNEFGLTGQTKLAQDVYLSGIIGYANVENADFTIHTDHDKFATATIQWRY